MFDGHPNFTFFCIKIIKLTINVVWIVECNGVVLDIELFILISKLAVYNVLDRIRGTEGNKKQDFVYFYLTKG